MSQTWIFQPNRTWFGWDEQGLSIFSGFPLRSLIREVTQNSLDAKRDGESKVKLRFELVSCSRDMIPGIDRIQSVLEQCLDVSKDESDDTKDNVAEALKYSQRMNFPVLQCTDFGTTGMKGPYVKGNSFYTYMNSKGSSPGSSERGGSHGHGKDAPLVNSALRTIFASTTYEDEGTLQHLNQGKCVFMSHFEDDEQCENVGRWGTVDMEPVDQLSSQFAWLNPHPEELGTTISILGFNHANTNGQWIDEMIGHLVINYFPAFIRDTLEIELKAGKKRVTLNTGNLEAHLNSDRVKTALEKLDSSIAAEFERTGYFVNAMSEADGGKLRSQQSSAPLNLVHFHLYVHDSAPRSYCLIRRNMKICEKVPRLERLPSVYDNFAAVIECGNEEANSLIRLMEPSEHDRVEVSRLKLERQKDGNKLWKQVSEKFKLVLDQEAKPEIKTAGKVDFLAKFLPDLAGEGEGIAFDEDEMGDGRDGRIEIKPMQKIKHRRVTRINNEQARPSDEPAQPESPDGLDNGGIPNDPEVPSSPGSQSNSGTSKSRVLDEEVVSQRVIELGSGELKLVFRLDSPQDCLVSLAEVGLSGAELVAISSSDRGTLEGTKVKLGKSDFDTFTHRVALTVTPQRSIVGGYVLQVEVAEK